MTYKTFNNLITRLLEIKKDVDNLNKALKVFEPDFNYLCFSKYETLVVDCLEEAVGDKTDWIEFFLYEMDGKFSKKPIAWDKDDKVIPLRNMQDLYNAIMCNGGVK